MQELPDRFSQLCVFNHAHRLHRLSNRQVPGTDRPGHMRRLRQRAVQRGTCSHGMCKLRCRQVQCGSWCGNVWRLPGWVEHRFGDVSNRLRRVHGR